MIMKRPCSVEWSTYDDLCRLCLLILGMCIPVILTAWWINQSTYGGFKVEQCCKKWLCYFYLKIFFKWLWDCISQNNEMNEWMCSSILLTCRSIRFTTVVMHLKKNLKKSFLRIKSGSKKYLHFLFVSQCTAHKGSCRLTKHMK